MVERNDQTACCRYPVLRKWEKEESERERVGYTCMIFNRAVKNENTYGQQKR